MVFDATFNIISAINSRVSGVKQGLVHPDWGYFELTEQMISMKPIKLIQTCFAMILKNIFIFFKIRRLVLFMVFDATFNIISAIN
jgi:hypothetical protein